MEILWNLIILDFSFYSSWDAIVPKRKPHDRTISHLLNPIFRDKVRTGSPRTNNGLFRLSLIFNPHIASAWDYLSRILHSVDKYPLAFFPDTNIVINKNSFEFWNLLKIRALEHNEVSVHISAPVYEEIYDWLKNPWRNKKLAASLDESIRKKERGWAGLYQIDPSNTSDFIALTGYSHLLGVRHRILDGLEQGVIGGVCRSKSDAMNYIQKYYGERTQLIAKKGAIKKKASGRYYFYDESHILCAIYYAISTGSEVVIISSDEDILECFYKTQYLLDTHYRAMLAGDLIAEGHWNTKGKEMTDKDYYGFKGGLLLYPYSSPDLREVLPHKFTPVCVSCVYIKPDGSATVLAFTFEQEMKRLFGIKAATGGLCSDRFDGRNVHVDLSLVGEDMAQHVGIGHDLAVKINQVDFSLSLLDVNYAIFCQERFDTWHIAD